MGYGRCPQSQKRAGISWLPPKDTRDPVLHSRAYPTLVSEAWWQREGADPQKLADDNVCRNAPHERNGALYTFAASETFRLSAQLVAVRVHRYRTFAVHRRNLL